MRNRTRNLLTCDRTTRSWCLHCDACNVAHKIHVLSWRTHNALRSSVLYHDRVANPRAHLASLILLDSECIMRPFWAGFLRNDVASYEAREGRNARKAARGIRSRKDFKETAPERAAFRQECCIEYFRRVLDLPCLHGTVWADGSMQIYFPRKAVTITSAQMLLIPFQGIHGSKPHRWALLEPLTPTAYGQVKTARALVVRARQFQRGSANYARVVSERYSVRVLA